MSKPLALKEKRIRRRPEDARVLILDAAETRMTVDGPAGLRLQDLLMDELFRWMDDYGYKFAPDLPIRLTEEGHWHGMHGVIGAGGGSISASAINGGIRLQAL